MKFYTYILYSESADQFYQGQTSYMQDYLRKHNRGLIPSSKSGAPWKLIWLTEKNSRAESLKLEKVIHNLSKRRIIAFMLRYEEGIQDNDTHDFLKRYLD